MFLWQISIINSSFEPKISLWTINFKRCRFRTILWGPKVLIIKYCYCQKIVKFQMSTSTTL